ncbi:hypothetical protein ADICYQ_0481 [Cyclobacterium qasimii M12-11B]|uniref:Uncharacterized protein n=1 Tax=Cyclobacterium qasimii M12-11B TaxID=641524 RepID=S7X5N8_9BACT|nr:hypothetical protein ADICYQ_0481 [Cyclobacterium qasimii M12-11B]
MFVSLAKSPKFKTQYAYRTIQEIVKFIIEKNEESLKSIST